MSATYEVSIGFPVDWRLQDALLMAKEGDWVPAIEADGARREGARMIELTDLVGLEGWDKDLRILCRRERPHSGAQLSVFDLSAELRHQCFATNSAGTVADLELRHRDIPGWRTAFAAPSRPGSTTFRDVATNDTWFQLAVGRRPDGLAGDHLSRR